MKLCKTHEERVAASGVWNRKFALLPTELDDSSVIWLERYDEMDEWVTHHAMMAFWAKRKKSVASVGTSSGGPGAPTSSQRNNVHKGGLG